MLRDETWAKTNSSKQVGGLAAVVFVNFKTAVANETKINGRECMYKKWITGKSQSVREKNN